MGRLRVTAAVVCGTFVLAGCGSEPPPPPTRDYGNGSAGSLQLRDVRLVTADGNRVVELVATFVNNGSADELVAVRAAPTTDGSSPVRATAAVLVPAAAVTRVGGEGHRVRLADPGDQIRAGYTAVVTLTFRRAGPAEVGLVAEDARGYLALYGP
jgi:hypothetical protein